MPLFSNYYALCAEHNIYQARYLGGWGHFIKQKIKTGGDTFGDE